MENNIDLYKKEQIEDILKNRISELNEIIGELNKENEELKNKLKYTKCLYPFYIVIELIKDILDIDLSEKDIFDIIKEGSITGEDFITNIFISKEDSKGTKLFSVLGIAKMISFLENTINKIDSYVNETFDKLPENVNVSTENINKAL